MPQGNFLGFPARLTALPQGLLPSLPVISTNKCLRWPFLCFSGGDVSISVCRLDWQPWGPRALAGMAGLAPPIRHFFMGLGVGVHTLIEHLADLVSVNRGKKPGSRRNEDLCLLVA